MLRRRRILFATFILILSSVSVWAIPNGPLISIPENYEVRLKYRDLIFGPRNVILDFEQSVEQQSGYNSAVSMQTLSQNDSYYLLFTNEEAGEYPLYSRGSYIIRRNSDNGQFTQIKVFIRSEPGSFARIHPAGRRATMDVYLRDNLLYKQVVLPMPIEQVALEPLTKIVRMTGEQIDWKLLFPLFERPEDVIIRGMVESLRANIDTLADSDDGAMDERGVYRFIDSLGINPEAGLNCSGFAKWVVDGLYQMRTGRLLSIESLKRKHLDSRGNAWSEQYEHERDPYFGLDWSRNLATSVLSLSGGRVGVEDADVRSVPFFEYIEDVGYSVQDLELVLYFLSRSEPGYFYIGSVNRDFGSNPVLKQHVHIVVLFPYFDKNGGFEVAVMERNLETSIESLENRYASDHIHLVRVPVYDGYSPPALNFAHD